MNKNVKLLDCTLRDGGYVNDWEFGSNNITFIFDRLSKAEVDIIEIGFLDDRRNFDLNRTIQPDTGSFSKVFSNAEETDSIVVAMIDYGTCSLDNIQPREDTFIDGIRIIFKKHNIENVVNYAREIKKKGYKVFLNMVSITSYSDYDVLDFIRLVNELGPYAVSIVDTYGLMHKNDLLHYYHLLDHNLDPDISIGYHSHNNFQVGYSNSIELIKHSSDRSLVVDGTLYGMGKSAGNAPLELLAMHLNENNGCCYDLNQIMEIIDVSIMSIYREKYWGYSFQYFVSAMQDCHPNYTNFLLDKKTLSMKSINEILSSISDEKKLMYDVNYIKQLYLDYQKRFSMEVEDGKELSNIFKDKDVLLIGPGSTIKTQSDKIAKAVQTDPIIVSINFIPHEYQTDYVFISNSKRYNNTFNKLKQTDAEIIGTNNITPMDKEFKYFLSYEDLVVEDELISDNSLILFLNYLKKSGSRRVLLAGFDGYTDNEPNYYDDSLEMSADYSIKKQKEFSIHMRQKIKEFAKDMIIEFVTDSMYTNKK